MNNLYTLIKNIADFPELSIGNRSLERLYAFIGGYLYHNTDVDRSCLDGFTEYVAKEYKISSDHNWASIISFFSNNENEAFEKFVELFDSFNKTD